MTAQPASHVHPLNAPDPVATEIRRLAALDPLAYERERKAAARRLGLRAAVLDAAVEAQREGGAPGADRSAEPDAPEPWPHPVATDALLGELVEAIGQHLVMSEAAIDAVALWALHTWVFDRFQHTPRLAITSPEKRCGKSTLMEVLRLVACNTLKADNITPAALFRAVEEWQPTLLIDEADTFMRDNLELRGVLNSGFEASGMVVRTEEVRGSLEPKEFCTFAPVAIACIGALPDTLADRAIPIAMRRAGPGEGRPAKLRAPGARERLARLGRMAERWAQDNRERLSLTPDIPERMGDREGDISVPLLAIADMAGGAWPGRARAALLALFEGGKADGEGTIGTMLLGDIRAIFDEGIAAWKPSQALCDELVAMEERPWGEWGRMRRPITGHALARLLKPYGIAPEVARTGGYGVQRGYARAAFEDAWRRYLDAPQDAGANPENTCSASEGGSKALQALHDCKSTVFPHSKVLQNGAPVTLCDGKRPNENNAVTDVTLRKPPGDGKYGGEEWEERL